MTLATLLVLALACGEEEPTDDSAAETDTDTDTDADTDTDTDADADTDSDTDTDVGDCSPSNVSGNTADSFAQSAGTWTFSNVSGGDGSQWTQGTEYEVVIDASGKVTYATDAGTASCCWDGSTFDTIYGTAGETDLTVVMAEDDNSNCSFTWQTVYGGVTRFSTQTADYVVTMLY